ncbi:hypothetical protein [Sorangium sp. So ce233]|uniref:hypothetical protein n=1 Tax=Sorangium sp. So ce233 TaxID=3133290 RepID=UPI003F63C1E3
MDFKPAIPIRGASNPTQQRNALKRGLGAAACPDGDDPTKAQPSTSKVRRRELGFKRAFTSPHADGRSSIQAHGRAERC